MIEVRLSGYYDSVTGKQLDRAELDELIYKLIQENEELTKHLQSLTKQRMQL